jgi:hypothetical protein
MVLHGESRPLEFTRMHDAPAPLDIRLYPITLDTSSLAVNRVGRAKSDHLVTKTVVEYNRATKDRKQHQPPILSRLPLMNLGSMKDLYSTLYACAWDPPDLFKFNLRATSSSYIDTQLL